MLRATFIALAISTLIPACATSMPEDELEGESAADGEDGKGDAAAAFTYFKVTPDLRQCSLDTACGGFDVARVNRTSTQCGRGLAQPSCKVYDIDWSGTAMPASVAESYEQMLRDGTPLLVRGDLVPSADDRGVTLAATEIWVPNTNAWNQYGVFTLVRQNSLQCITAPCPTLTERKLNSNLSANITGLDFDYAKPAPADLDRAQLALAGSDGLVVVGYRYYDELGGKARTADQFFVRAPVPLH